MPDELKLVVGDSFLPLYQGKYKDKFIAIEGKRGTGKTRAILTHITLRALAHPNSKWLVLRKTRTKLTETILATLEDYVFPQLGIPFTRIDREHRRKYDLPGGAVIIPMALDDPSRTQSAEISGGYVAEATELEDSKDVTSLAGAMRREGIDYHQMIVDFNPSNPHHWANQMCEDFPDSLRLVDSPEAYQRLLEANLRPAPAGKWKRIVTCAADNPAFFDSKTWSVTKRGQDYIDSLGYLDPITKDRWLRGLWVQDEGGVFPEFRPEIHVVPDFTPPPEWPQALGLDPGWNFCGIVWMAVSPDGGLYVYDSIMEGHKSFAEHLDEIKRRNESDGRNVERYFGDPNELFSSRAQGPSCATQAQAKGFRFIPWPRDAGPAFDAGVEAVRNVLTTPEGTPFYLRVCKRAVGVQANFATWAYKKNAKGLLVAGADRYNESDDHCLDPLRGIIQSGYLQNRWKRMQQEAA